MKYRNDLKRRVLAGLFAGAALCLAAPAVLAAGSPIPNGTIPDGGHFIGGKDAGTITPNGTQMDIHQYNQNAVIVWDKGFNVGANATVNFNGPQDGYNTLNYDKSNSMSQIYGTINANNNGNIYIVNPAGVEIGNSAQINVGSLYVSNRNLDDFIKENMTAPEDMAAFIQQGTTTDAVLMSLGNVNANSVIFDGNRIVIDTERLKNTDGDKKLGADDITILTTNENNVVIGYDAYVNEKDEDGNIIGYKGANSSGVKLAKVNNGYFKKADGYMWVEDVEQLQAIDTNLGGNYALRNSIDATATQDWNDKKGFKPIGIDNTGKVIVENSKYGFHGNFDGLSYNIFNLNINRADAVNVGLFGVLHEAEINNVTFVGGAITGGNVVGSLAGAVLGNTHVNNVMNSASVTGGADVGGIIGYSGDNVDGSSAEQTGTSGSTFTGLINTGTVTGKKQEHIGEDNNVGGLIGYLYNGTLGGTSYNLGAVTGSGYNVGGLVGHALNATLGDGKNLIYNRLNVTGAYNVGGIVGNMEGTTVQNAENSGTVTATGYTDGKYTYHSATVKGENGSDGTVTVDVYVANAGGIAGSASGNSTITDVLNTGNVSSASKTFTEPVTNVNGNDTKDVTSTYYTAGNVGGIVGSAVNTNITNATNRENEIRGAHNVGGIAGYFANSDNATGPYKVTNGINDGGDIMATGARYENSFVKETIRNNNGRESFTVGNMGGIVGYMDGDNVYITSSANRGTVHTLEPKNPEFVGSASKAANAGGIVGKIDRNKTLKPNEEQGETWTDVLGQGYMNAAISNSYNTGDVMGYTGIGGIAGMMYNGEIAGSYNLGYLRTTRQSDTKTSGMIDPINMGGIVGDTTEGSSARALLYDVYNKGQIGDENYDYFGRHVGGIVGRLSGTVEKAYNTGAIYNGYNVVGGIAGWMYTGSINNAFNTGNITVVNNNHSASSQVGGIVGAADVSIANITLSNVYNLGTLRSFWVHKDDEKSHSSLGGIIGDVYRYNSAGGDHPFNGDHVTIKNAYTTGNLYIDDAENGGKIGSIWANAGSGHFEVENTYYIQPDTNLPFKNLYDADNPTGDRDNSNKAIDFDKKDNMVDGEYKNQYTYTDAEGTHSLDVSSANGVVNITENEGWRIYEGTTPILNAFLPNAEDYFSGESGKNPSLEGIGSIQYGTAYDPLLTIVNAAQGTTNLEFNWQDLKINNDAGLAVYGAGLTLNDFMSTGGSGYFGGLIYSDGALTIKADTAGGNPHSITGDVALGSASQLYGSSVTINADGQVTIYGSVTATGNVQDGTSWDGKQYTETLKNTDGSISITGGSVDIYGQLTSADGQSVKVPGINGMATGWEPGTVGDEHEAMSDIGDRFSYTTGKYNVTGNISIAANDAEDGHVNVYYGNKGEGLVTTGGDLTVTASGDIYMDSDLSIGGDLTLNAGQVKDSEGNPVTVDGLQEAVLDISNIGKVQAANGMLENALTGLHAFLNHFAKNGTDGGEITLGGEETKLAVDMWGDGAFDLTKYDLPGEVGATLADKLDQLYINRGTEKGKHYTYIWVSTGEQLKGIQQYKKNNSNSNILSYNFALKNDIDASDVTDYEAIGAGAENGYTGTFDGRDNRIIGLDTTKRTDGKTLTNVGIFDTIGKNADGTEQVGTVEDLRVYSGTFHGTNNAGAVAGVNKGNISNVTAFGNVVDVQNTANEVSYAGGIVGANEGSITGASAVGTATQSSTTTATGEHAAAGGIAGLNDEKGTISNSTSNSAVNASAGNATALGGVAGVNAGTLTNVDSLGVTTGVYKGNTTQYSDNVGGIAGINQAGGTVESAYNESIVSGRENVGGVLGTNLAQTGSDKKSPVSNVANAADVTGESAGNDSKHVGGLVGDNKGSITNGRNNGKITGNNYVGGLVGENGKDSTLSNLVNDEAASITGDKYVGGIAGSNAGTITADEENDNLVNRGSITGQMYVGGVAGVNTGTIANTISSIALHVKTDAKEVAEGGDLPQYFGGVVGQNSGIIKGATNESSVDVAADGASMVGGIIGENTETGKLEGTIANEGFVSGKSDVGGIIGSNQNTEILNNDDKNDRLVVSNSGLVQAEDGGAAGIFYNNTGAINNADLTNTGMVIGGKDAASITGGLFGTNSGDITNSTLTNNGTVYGGGTVGGLIGENRGNISTSSLINSVNGKVIGLNNVGGLIGQNYGTITGGRTEKNEQGKDTDVGYYKYQIYNNGTITVGTWTDGSDGSDGSDPDGKIADGEIKTDGVSGSNIGGLVGLNGYDEETGKTGSITAGYNTGAIDAAYSENVGGIAGTNTGKLDQVFNTVITGVGTDGSNVYGSITGGTNVGGIVGSNETNSTSGGGIVGADEVGGTVSNAYNTTGVSGNRNVGLIAGSNTSTADNSISNVYSIGAGRDRLIGSDSVDDVVPNGFILSESKAKKSESYTGLDFADTDEFSKESLDGIWKIYDGSSMALLKVFLTKAEVTDPNLVYNGQEQVIGIDSVKAMYGDVTIPPLGQNGHKDAGNYDDWLYSSQIAASGTEADGTFNPNHLGYDIVYTTENGNVGIKKAVITVTGNRVDRTYGSADITSSTDGNGVLIGGNKDYGFTIEAGKNTTITDAMKAELTDSNLGFDKDQISDGALSKESGKTTDNVGEYTWGTNLTLSDTLKGNYTFVAEGGTNSITATVAGKSYVNKAKLEITADSKTIYVGGNPNYTGTVISFVNGDSFQVVFGVEDSSIESVVDTHTDAIGFWYDGSFYTQNTSGLQSLFGGNYNITVIPGTLTVKDLPSGMPDISDSERWNTLLRDAPWDRNRNFRERKAEVHFLAGGMTL